MNYFKLKNAVINLDEVAGARYSFLCDEIYVRFKETNDSFTIPYVSIEDWAHFCDALGQNKPIE